MAYTATAAWMLPLSSLPLVTDARWLAAMSIRIRPATNRAAPSDRMKENRARIDPTPPILLARESEDTTWASRIRS